MPAGHAAEDADGATAPVTPVAQGPSWSFEGTGGYFAVDHPYFGAGERRNGWGEGFSRVRLAYGRPDGLWISASGVGLGTAGKDYYGVHDLGDGRLDQLVAGAANVGGSGVSLAVGRQDLVMGDGFLIGDGFRDTRAALWSIPLNFYDALRADWARGALHALAFGANLSPSFGGEGAYPRGLVYGGEFGLHGAGGSDAAVAALRMDDSHATDMNARAYSLRASGRAGAVTLSGEAVLEGGTLGGRALRGRGGHVTLVAPFRAKGSPVVTAEYFYFSGDDPNTTQNEAYYPWQYRWNDWSQYYVGDLLSATVGTASNMKIVRAQVGLAPREGTGVRLLAHRFDLALNPWAGLIRDPWPDAWRRASAFGYEYDLVVDQAFGDHWSAWVMGAYATPLDAARRDWGSARCGQVFTSVSWKFGGPGSAAGPPAAGP